MDRERGGISEAVLSTPLALCKCRGSQAASTLTRMVPSTHHPPSPEGDRGTGQ